MSEGFPQYLRLAPKYRLTAYVREEVTPSPTFSASRRRSKSSSTKHGLKTSASLGVFFKKRSKSTSSKPALNSSVSADTPTSIEVSEDGRRRSTLPPLETDFSLSRTPRRTINGASVTEEMDSGRRLKKVSVEVDKKIIKHLRRDLSRRLEKRLAQLYDPNFADVEDDEEVTHGHHKHRTNSHHEKKTSIFEKYSEIGDKLTNGDAAMKGRRRSSSTKTSKPGTQAGGGTGGKGGGGAASSAALMNGHDHAAPLRSPLKKTSMTPSSPAPAAGSGTFSHSHLLPDINAGEGGGGGGTEAASRKSSKRSSVRGSTKSVSVKATVPHGNTDHAQDPASSEIYPDGQQALPHGQDSEGSRSDSDKELTALLPQGDRGNKRPEDPEEEGESSGPEMSFRSLVISPVPTPLLYRPETREMTRLSREDCVTQVLNGFVYRPCPPDNKIVRVFVMGGYTDTAVERTVLMEQVYPKLREFCTLHGRDLQISDLHWGVKDGITDDHRVPEVIRRVLAKCQDSYNGFNLFMVLGQKYGAYVLPTEIPVEEFENVLLACRLYREKQVKFIRTSIADIEATRAERERLRQLEQGASSVIMTPTVTETESTGEPGNLATNETVVVLQREEAEHEEGDANLGDPRAASQQAHSSMAVTRKEQASIKALRESEDDVPDTGLLEQWYRLDESVVPPVFRLQNISTEFTDIVRNDGKRRDMAKVQWREVAAKIQRTLQTFAPEVVHSPMELKKYFTSELEQEVEQALESEYSRSHTLCVLRTIPELPSRLQDPAADDYLDLNGGGKARTLEAGASKRQAVLRDEVVLRQIPLSSVAEFSVEWDPSGVREHGFRNHLVYLERLCAFLLDTAKRRLAEYLQDSSDSSWKSVLFKEVTHHVCFCQERVNKFHGRKDLLTLIKSYIRSNARHPLVLYGRNGSGKSAILAKTAKDIHKWFRGGDTDYRVLVRIIGVTEESSTVRTLLKSLCLQMCHIFANSPAEVPSDVKGLVNDFAHRMTQATEERPLVVVLDGVDGLSEEYEGRKMGWMPRDLPPHVKVIVSTLSEESLECLPALRKLLAGKPDAFLEVTQLPEEDAAAIVNHWLNQAGRCLTTHQSGVLMEAYRKCPVPLFLKVAFNDTLQWRSYSNPEMCRLADGVKKLATLRFARLEREHGEPLVRRALGYVTAGRHGVTNNELEDLLSLDDAVMDEVQNVYHPPRRRLPPLLLARVLYDLQDMLMEYAADNVMTLRWAHSQFEEAARERYLDQRDKAPSYHKALAEYFLSTWAATPKPFAGNEKGADRLVAPQALYLEPEDSRHDGTDRVYNLRKVNELPFHLLNAQLLTELRSAVLMNFEWILAKLCGTSLRDLLEEYSTVVTLNPDDLELKMVADALHLSGRALRQEPRQLGGQLVGRLQGVVARDAPKAPGDPRKYPSLQKLLEQASCSSLPALIPSVECLTQPGGVLFDLLSGHTDEITAVALTSDGLRAVTSSLDDTIKLWDLRTGRVVKTMEGVGAKVTALRTAKNNSVLVTVEGTLVRLWSLRTGACLMTVAERPDPAAVCVALEGQVLVVMNEGTNTFRSWDLDTLQQLCQVEAPEERGVHKERSLLLADAVYNELVLHAFRSGSAAAVQHAKTGQVVRTLQCNEPGSSIAAVAVSRDYHVVCCRQQYMHLHELHVLELFDSRKGNYLRSVRGCVYDNVTALYVNLVGSHALAVCAFEKQQMSDIAVWNLETEDHKHLARHPLQATAAACLDFRYCLTAARGQHALRIWNLSGKVNQPAPSLKKQLGIAEVLPMLDNPRYCVAKAVNHGPISVWNVAKGKCLQAAVRVERGLSESSDAVVVRNTRLVILTDRGFSSVTEDSRPVFQTVLIYDLRAKRYERKLTGCYIAPAPSHEYMLLDGERMLGPSETRTHFIIWSLTNGHADKRIKTNFKERKKMEVGLQGVTLTDVGTARAKTPKNGGSNPGSFMTPWDRRAETRSARQRRLEKEAEAERLRLEELRREKDNAIEQFIVSGDQKWIVASFYAHHLCVFDIEHHKHTQTLENEHSLLLLHVAALTWDGSHLVHANYDERDKVSYVTLWDCVTGDVKRRLKRETDVCALGITSDASRVVIGKAPNQLHIWDPVKSSSLRRARGYDGLRFSLGSRIFVQDDVGRAVVFAEDISLWDLDKAIVLAVFTPDTRVLSCQSMLNGQLIVFGLWERQDLVALKLSGRSVAPVDVTGGVELFGETTGDTTDEEEGEEDGEGGGEGEGKKEA